MERSLLILLLVTVFFLPAVGVYAETKEDVIMTEISISMNTDYHRCGFSWDGDDKMTYTAILQSVEEDGAVRDLVTEYCQYPHLQGDDYVYYCCQEYGVPYRMRLKVVGNMDGTDTAEGFSDEFDPVEFWPDKDELSFDQDIDVKSIRSISWYSTGTSVEQNWRYTAAIYDDICSLYFRNSSSSEKEIRISTGRWDKLISLLEKGKMIRSRVPDPTIVELDGSSAGKDISFEESEEDHRLSYYVFSCDKDTENEIEKWFRSSASWSIYGWKLYATLGTAVFLLIALFLLIKKGRH